jgi:hypothetical protein
VSAGDDYETSFMVNCHDTLSMKSFLINLATLSLP